MRKHFTSCLNWAGHSISAQLQWCCTITQRSLDAPPSAGRVWLAVADTRLKARNNPNGVKSESEVKQHLIYDKNNTYKDPAARREQWGKGGDEYH